MYGSGFRAPKTFGLFQGAFMKRMEGVGDFGVLETRTEWRRSHIWTLRGMLVSTHGPLSSSFLWFIFRIL